MSVTSSVILKYLERFGTQIVTVVLNIILARLLIPEDFGTLAILNVFVVLAQAISQNGINLALIQKKTIDEDDYSTGFVLCFAFSALLYFMIFCGAPLVSFLYNTELITVYLRTISISLFPGAVNAIYLAKTMREMRFGIIMITGIISTISSCIIGVIMAYLGFGVWSLIFSQIILAVILCVTLTLSLKWKLAIIFSFQRAKSILSYGYKIVLGSMLDNLYYDVESLFLGKMFSRSELGIFTNARTYPLRIVSSVKDTIASVIFPAMSMKQEDDVAMREITKKSIQSFSFIVFPLMIGFSLVSKEFITLFLTEKWLGCLFPMQVFSIGVALVALRSPNTQIIKAKGNASLYLKLECIQKALLFLALIISASISRTINAISMGSLLSIILTTLITMELCGRKIHYGVFQQIKDIAPIIISVAFMSITILIFEKNISSDFSSMVTLLLKISIGVITFFVCALISCRELLKGMIQSIRQTLYSFLKNSKLHGIKQ